ncbi:PspC domain-containing protein [Kineothrix sp. MB12-C1]|uniref:PspC domain-containing protein n=1 Tax=Kineothrix sp. MB12-C1 TaxID=3070215 RepID=UPI0027D204FF|nr:PspC domain-containing protein [Kineothrix sp. MB12-C1]WMC91921.1 PspC domain-containing protein [Kineothrix sp. MB12-C1]
MEDNYKKLKRTNRSNKMICGVCGGIGQYLGMDPTVVRLLWLIFSIASFGTGLLVYLIAAIIIPEED